MWEIWRACRKSSLKNGELKNAVITYLFYPCANQESDDVSTKHFWSKTSPKQLKTQFKKKKKKKEKHKHIQFVRHNLENPKLIWKDVICSIFISSNLPCGHLSCWYIWSLCVCPAESNTLFVLFVPLACGLFLSLFFLRSTRSRQREERAPAENQSISSSTRNLVNEMLPV